MKINTNSMKKVYEELFNTFCKKNHDYGNSFELSLDKHGLVAGVVRMEDKMNRLSTLVDSDTDAQIASESLVDTLMDLSNYAAMSACWLIEQDKKTRDEYYAKNFHKLSTVARNSTYGVEDEEPTESGKFTGLKVWGDDTGEGLSGSVITTMGREEVEKTFHLSSFEGHQEKVNERAYYEKDGVSDEEIIKNWGLVGDSKTVRSRTTGYYLVEDDNPELFQKIFGVLRKHKNSSATWKPAPEDITKASSLSMMVEDFNHPLNEPKQFSTKLKGLENGYFIRQHINSDNSYRYTIAFNPEGTIKTQDGEEKPYLLECFGNDYYGMNVWALHVFDTREDMVAALNYDLKVSSSNESMNFGDSIKGLDIKVSVFSDLTLEVLETWIDTFGLAFNNQMLSEELRTEESIQLYQGIKTFGPVVISEKTGALIIHGQLRENSFKRPCEFIWFSDTKEVLLEVDEVIPKFNSDGIIYGVIYENDKYIRLFNPLYDDMKNKIMSKFYAWHAWSGSELKNLVFFNEDDAVESGYLTSKNGKLQIDFEDSEVYWDEI